MESWYKVSFKNQKKEEVSCVEPRLYCSRFKSFIANQVLVNEDDLKEHEVKLSMPGIKEALFHKLITEFDDEYSDYIK